MTAQILPVIERHARRAQPLAEGAREVMPPNLRHAGALLRNYVVGGMFWFWENRFVGSYLAFSCDSRSKLGP